MQLLFSFWFLSYTRKLFSELLRRLAEFLPKQLIKMCQIFIADLGCNGFHGFICFQQQLLGHSKTPVLQQLFESPPCILLDELTVSVKRLVIAVRKCGEIRLSVMLFDFIQRRLYKLLLIVRRISLAAPQPLSDLG